MPVQPAALELLAALAPVLERWGRWYLFGAQAVILHGVPRLSADVDVTLALAPDTPDRFAAEMQSAGFALAVDDPDFVRRTRVLPFVHRATGMPLDVVLAGSGLEDEFLNRAVPIEVGGTRVPLIEVGDLVIAKVLAGRSKDLDDARGLWRIHRRTLDVRRIRRTLRLLEEALDQGDLLSSFNEIARVRHTRRSNPTRRPERS
ncbi:MAG: nucleotidyltransferase [Acidobacteria bacterium]|nr:nucleotidyltransferase [Acidobacteriota bacterium]